MSYEITYPNAAPMVQAERKANLPPLMHYRHGTVAEHVAQEEERTYWLECGGERNVQMVMAMLDYVSNACGYRLAILREIEHRIGASKDYCEMSIQSIGDNFNSARPDRPLKSMDMRLYRKDLKPLAGGR